MDLEKPVIQGHLHLQTNKQRGVVRIAIRGEEIPCFLFCDVDVDTLTHLIADLTDRREDLLNPKRIKLWRNSND